MRCQADGLILHAARVQDRKALSKTDGNSQAVWDLIVIQEPLRHGSCGKRDFAHSGNLPFKQSLPPWKPWSLLVC